MNNIIVRIALQPKRYLAKLLLKFTFCLSDKQYLKALFMYRFGYSLDLKNPKTFCEKLQWLKLYDRKPEYARMVDKYEVKKYVADKIGNEYIIPTLGVWDAPEDIEWEELPNQFVLKTTHGGGGNGVIVCKDKTKLDIKAVCKQLHKSLSSDLYKTFREWPYKNVSKRIIAESFLASPSGELEDYKFFCFDGEPKFLYISDSTNHELVFLNTDWTEAEFGRSDYKPLTNIPPKPDNLDEMLDIARKLSNGKAHVRVDLYNVNKHIYFGELTFYTGAGFIPFTPKEYDKVLGEMLKLPSGGGGKNPDNKQ